MLPFLKLQVLIFIKP